MTLESEARSYQPLRATTTDNEKFFGIDVVLWTSVLENALSMFRYLSRLTHVFIGVENAFSRLCRICTFLPAVQPSLRARTKLRAMFGTGLSSVRRHKSRRPRSTFAMFHNTQLQVGNMCSPCVVGTKHLPDMVEARRTAANLFRQHSSTTQGFNPQRKEALRCLTS